MAWGQALAPVLPPRETQQASTTANLRSPSLGLAHKLPRAQHGGNEKKTKTKKHTKPTLSAHKIVFLFALLPSTVGFMGLAWSTSRQALGWSRNGTIGISSGPELAFTWLNRCTTLVWQVSLRLSQAGMNMLR